MKFIRMTAVHANDIKKWAEDPEIHKWIHVNDWDAYIEAFKDSRNHFDYAVLDDDGILIGLATGEKADDHVSVSIIVNPSVCGQGFGGRILDEMEQNRNRLFQCNPKYLFAGIFPGNAASIRCFEKAGYVLSGTGKDGELDYRLTFDAAKDAGARGQPNYLDSDGRMKLFPSKQSVRLEALEWLARKFEFDRRYTEKEVNAILDLNHTFNDYFLLRRELINNKLLTRLPDGTQYWRDKP